MAISVLETEVNGDEERLCLSETGLASADRRALTLTIPPLQTLGTSALSSFLSQILTRVYIQITGLWLSHNMGRDLISWKKN